MENSASKFEQRSISGLDAIRLEQDQQDAIKALTEILLDSGQLGVNAPKVYERVGDILFQIFQIATCQWGCRHGDHVIENLLRRFYNSACAALRLMASGLYDEALGPIRVMAEIVNLLQAFEKDSNYLQQWKVSSPKQRLNKFSPFRVRCFIESQRLNPVVNQEVYSKLCENGIHVSPTSISLSHDLVATLYAGGHFAMPGAFLILNTLAWIVGPCLLIAARLIEVTDERYQTLRSAVIDLLYVAQGLKIDNYEKTFLNLRADYLRQLVSKKLDEMNEQEWEELATQLEQELIKRGEQEKLQTMSEQEMLDEFGKWAYHEVSKQLYKKLQEQNLLQTVTASRLALARQMKRKMQVHDKPD